MERQTYKYENVVNDILCYKRRRKDNRNTNKKNKNYSDTSTCIRSTFLVTITNTNDKKETTGVSDQKTTDI